MNGDERRDSGYISGDELRSAGRAVRPRDAATLIIVRNDSSRPRVLMGRRAARHAFMPDKFVFPGGGVDRSDSRILPPRDLHPEVMKRLCRGCSATRARALALAAIRETYEETGLIIGEGGTRPLQSRSPPWSAFLQSGANPRLDVLHLVARAITPPYRNRRFDARFFMVDAGHIHGELQERPEGSGELLDLHWVGVDEAQRMEQLPHITRVVLGALERRLQEGAGHEVPGPFIYVRHGKTVVDTI